LEGLTAVAIPTQYKALIGKASKAKTFEVEKGQIRRFAAAIGEENLIHFDEAAAKSAGFASIVGPPTFASALHSTDDLYAQLSLDPSNAMHAEEEYEYFRPIVAGDEVTVSHKVVDIYDKTTPTGHLVFVVVETRGNDKKNRPIFKGRRVLVELRRT
jgi:acyl dehydratase